MSESEGYNGWKNYPTWAVNLWLANDEGLYRATTEFVEREYNSPDALRFSNSRRLHVADALRTWVRDELAPDLGASFAADLLGYALDEVDWNEIADAWIESVSEQTA